VFKEHGLQAIVVKQQNGFMDNQDRPDRACVRPEPSRPPSRPLPRARARRRERLRPARRRQPRVVPAASGSAAPAASGSRLRRRRRPSASPSPRRPSAAPAIWLGCPVRSPGTAHRSTPSSDPTARAARWWSRPREGPSGDRRAGVADHGSGVVSSDLIRPGADPPPGRLDRHPAVDHLPVPAT
jgi:hypothetical protein